MPNKRDLKLDEYGISKFAYRELSNFCLQYEDKKNKISDLHNPYNSPQITGMPHASGISNPVEQAALKAEQLSRDVELIKRTVEETDIGIAEAILKNVTQGIQYDYMEVPCGRRQFYTKRRKFFYLLAIKKGMV